MFCLCTAREQYIHFLYLRIHYQIRQYAYDGVFCEFLFMTIAKIYIDILLFVLLGFFVMLLYLLLLLHTFVWFKGSYLRNI